MKASLMNLLSHQKTGDSFSVFSLTTFLGLLSSQFLVLLCPFLQYVEDGNIHKLPHLAPKQGTQLERAPMNDESECNNSEILTTFKRNLSIECEGYDHLLHRYNYVVNRCRYWMVQIKWNSECKQVWGYTREATLTSLKNRIWS